MKTFAFNSHNQCINKEILFTLCVDKQKVEITYGIKNNILYFGSSIEVGCVATGFGCNLNYKEAIEEVSTVMAQQCYLNKIDEILQPFVVLFEIKYKEMKQLINKQ